MPYRVDIRNVGDDAFDRLIELGALDAERLQDGIAAVMPDGVAPEQVASALGVDISVSAVAGRDAGSVWILRPRAVTIGRLRIVPAESEAAAGDLRLIDAAAFGTGLHPTTALCVEALQDAVDERVAPPHAVLDVGTGSGVLALAALMLGVRRALGIDVDDDALRVAADNARLNRLGDRLELQRGGPETLTDRWPLVLANVLASPLIEMAPALVQRVGHHGRLVLSGIPRSVEADVHKAYCRLGMRRLRVTSRGGWVALVLQASW